jgi:flagellar protein FlaG
MGVVMVAEIDAIGGVAAADPSSGMAFRPPDQRVARSEAPPRYRPVESTQSTPSGDVGLVFEVNQESRELVIKIVNRETHQVIRQIPAEEVQRLRAAMQSLLGVVLDRTG